MDIKTVEQYLKLRAEIQNEILQIDGEIADLKLRIAQFEEYREQLESALNPGLGDVIDLKIGEAQNNGSNMEKLLDFIGKNPGASRKDIRDLFDGELEENQVKHLLGRASNKNNTIVNMGTRINPKWHLTGKKAKK